MKKKTQVLATFWVSLIWESSEKMEWKQTEILNNQINLKIKELQGPFKYDYDTIECIKNPGTDLLKGIKIW